MDKHSDREHALYAPSSMKRIINCHGSVAASAEFDEKTNDYAEEGTECHEAAAAILNGESWDKAVKDLTEEQEWIVEEYTTYCFDLIDRLIEKYGKKNVKVWVETRVRSSRRRFQNNHGTADLRILAGRTLAVIDLKAGFVEVPLGTPEDPNPQLANYGWLSIEHDDLWDEIDNVRLTIVQPRVREKPITITMTPEQLEEFAQKIAEAIRIIESGDVSRNAGDWCKYCLAKGACSTLREATVAKAKIRFDDIKQARNYSPEELIEILDEAEIIQTHIDGVRMHVLNEMMKGRLKGRGWKLVGKRPVAKWLDHDKVVDYLFKSLAVDASIAFKPKPLTPLQLETALKHAKIPKFDLSPYFEKKSSGPTLARESDKREEYKPDIFGKLGEDE